MALAEARFMTTTQASASDPATELEERSQLTEEPIEDRSFLTVIRVLLLVQAGIAITSLLEVTIVGFGQGVPLVVPMALTGGGAVLSLLLAGRIGRVGRKARRTVLWMQYAWLSAAAIDLVVSLLMTQRLLEPVPILTRIVVPLAIVRMLRSSRARDLFDVPPSRRQRRRARKLALRQVTAS